MIRFTVGPVYVGAGSTRLGFWRLRRFQERVREALEDGRDTLLVAPTGSGKTLTLLLADRGAVGVYPNNTLLLDQQRSLHRILTEALGGRLYSRETDGGVDVLRVYELPPENRAEVPIGDYRRVAVALISGRYIGYETGEDGRLVPKRTVILRRIVERICHPRPGEAMPYIITLATPDTALMIMAGIYRDFEKVGYTVHDFLLAAADGLGDISWLLSKHRVALVNEMGDLARIRQCLLKYPWFIDEFHLYGIYEAYGLLPLLKVYRDYVGWEEPFILSSATPKGDLYRLVEEQYRLAVVREDGSDTGDPDALVRGETRVEVVPVEVDGFGLTKWLRVGYRAHLVVEERIGEILEVAGNGGNVFIVVDRVNQVPPIVDVLVKYGVSPECSVSIKPEGCSEGEEKVVVGSESISQGIDRPNVRYGIITAYNWASLLQRFGRIGRKVDSRIVLLVPVLSSGVPFSSLDGAIISYAEFAGAVAEEVPNIDFTNIYKPRSYLRLMEQRARLLEYAAVIGFAQVSKPGGTLEELARLAGRDAPMLLDMFYGPPEMIARLLTFRGGGFPVLVRKPGGSVEETDVSTVLRNYKVLGVSTVKREGRRVLVLDVSLEPARQTLVMRPDPSRQGSARSDLVMWLAGRITTIGELARLGYVLYIVPWGERGVEGLEVPLTGDVSGQPVALLKLRRELVDAYSYSARGVEVVAGEKRLIGLFL